MKTRSYPQVPSQPYAWPFDGPWSAQDTAALAVDLVVMPKESVLDMETTREVRRTADKLLMRLRSREIRIVFSVHPEYDGDSGVVTCDAEPRLAQGVTLLQPAPEDHVAFSQGLSAFFRSDLDDTLADWGIRNLLVLGVTTDGQVHSSMRDANDRGFECLLVEDGCASGEEKHHESVIQITRFGNGLFGTTARMADVVSTLD